MHADAAGDIMLNKFLISFQIWQRPAAAVEFVIANSFGMLGDFENV